MVNFNPSIPDFFRKYSFLKISQQVFTLIIGTTLIFHSFQLVEGSDKPEVASPTIFEFIPERAKQVRGSKFNQKKKSAHP